MAENSFAKFYIGKATYKKRFRVGHLPLKISVEYRTFLNVLQNCFLVNFAKFLKIPFFYRTTPGGRPATLLDGLQHRCFPVNIAKFERAPILRNGCF